MRAMPAHRCGTSIRLYFKILQYKTRPLFPAPPFLHAARLTVLGIYALMILTQAGCIWLPAARDDFSILGNGVFSNLIREAYSEKVLTPGVGDHVGVGRIDRQKATKLARELLLGKSRPQVIELFTREGGRCLPQAHSGKEEFLTCEVDRKWKLKNIGAPFDTKFWSDPAAKLIFKITLSETDAVAGVALDIVDITVIKPIYSKPNYSHYF